MSLDKLALGTWLMGGTKEPDPDNDDAADKAVIDLAIENGINLIDTAQNYAAGRCEELVGESLAVRDRSEYKILTKQQSSRLEFDQVIEDAHDSMHRLRIDYIDHFVCHAPGQDGVVKGFFEATNELVKQGRVKYVGVSNFGPKHLAQALQLSDVPIALNQVHISLVDDDVFSSGTYDFCVDNNIPLQAYRALSDFTPDLENYDLIKSHADKLGVSVQQLTIAYVNSYQGMHFTVRASSAEHWDQIKAALDIKLDQAVIDSLRSSHKDKAGNFGHFLNR